MKKVILTLAIVISCMSAFASDEKVSEKVLEAFQTEFNAVKNVSWTTGDNYFKAEFIFNNQRVQAFYSVEGELLGLTRYITSLDLPLSLQANLKKNYSDYWISDVFEVSKSDATGYYI
ncbi:MAG TPA: hypothetical protein VHM26_06245, partial [Chitinophagaceae bacterium]|nr:hypothetical protein [Chitinophagaceae bacterium]